MKQTSKTFSHRIRNENPLLDEIIDFAIRKLNKIINESRGKIGESGQHHEHKDLGEFMKDTIFRSKTSLPVVLASLIYLDRFGKKLVESDDVVINCTHKLFLASLVIACKYANDDTYTNSTWIKICQEWKVDELNLMEMILLKKLGFKLTVEKEDLNAYLKENFELGRHHTGGSSPRRWFQFLETA